jgi:MOSC domain-containing protein YiiM
MSGINALNELLIHTQSIGQPQILTDERGTWRSAIDRTPVIGSVGLRFSGLAGDQVADTRHHGSPDQAVCCHPIDHYAFWNEFYQLQDPENLLKPGSLGENWTLSGASERDICVGDVFSVGTARVQVSGPRYPCSKQERKVMLKDFVRHTKETMRTGFYLRVLVEGIVQVGDRLELEDRPQPDLSLEQINTCMFSEVDPTIVRLALQAKELSAGWKKMLER